LSGSIEKKVKKLVRKFKTRDPFELCACLGIWIYKDMPLGNVKGFYLYLKRKKVIFINSNLDDNIKLLICAHELAHAVLHPRDNIYFKKNNTYFVLKKYEIAANTFAAELLITAEMLMEHPMYFSIQELAASLYVPAEILERKLGLYEGGYPRRSEQGMLE
jgi:Zn-dependent peptidase ImmA (M78 family)